MKRRRKKGGVVPASEARTTIEGGSIPPELVRLATRAVPTTGLSRSSPVALGMPIELLKQIAEQLEVEVD
jgi:hypothetical protein